MRPALLALLLIATPAAAQQAPFCVVSNAGTQCFYYSLQQCQSAARTFQGMCSANPQAMQQQQQPVQISPPRPMQPYAGPSIMDNVMRGFEMGQAGRRAAQEQQEHNARMRLLQAQTAQQSEPATSVIYKCHDSAGRSMLTTTPRVGCMVEAVE